MAFTEAVAGTAGAGGWLLPVGVTLAGVFSVAYSMRLVHDTFFNGPLGDVPNRHPHEPPWGMKAPVALLAVLCLCVGLAPAWAAGPLVHAAATALVGGQALPDYHLALWHGFNLPLLMSAVALVGGLGLYAALAQARRLHGLLSESWFGPVNGRQLFEGLMAGLFAWSARVTTRLENGSLQRYVAWLLAAALVAGGWPLWGAGLGGGYWLAYKNRATSADWQKIPTPFWVATSLSLAVVAIIFVFIVRRVFAAQRQDFCTTQGTPTAA